MFSTYGPPLEMVTYFRYLGRLILAANDDFPEVIWNLAKARAVWRRRRSLLSRYGARLRVSDFFLKALVQSVFLFGAETWVVTPCLVWVLGGF